QAVRSIDMRQLAPEGVPLTFSGSAAVLAKAGFKAGVTLGVLTGPGFGKSAETITGTTLLSALNGGAGLNSKLTIDGNDVLVTFRDGSDLAIDLDTLKLGNGTDPGSATVNDL